MQNWLICTHRLNIFNTQVEKKNREVFILQKWNYQRPTWNIQDSDKRICSFWYIAFHWGKRNSTCQTFPERGWLEMLSNGGSSTEIACCDRMKRGAFQVAQTFKFVHVFSGWKYFWTKKNKSNVHIFTKLIYF